MKADRTRWLRALLIALALGAAAAGLTESLVVALLTFGTAAWFLRPKGRTDTPLRPPAPLPARGSHEGHGRRADAPAPPRARGGVARKTSPTATGTTVICKQVTPERQEWVSSRTGRLYDVLSHNGPPNARPGDRGRVTLSSAGWRILPEEPEHPEQLDDEQLDAEQIDPQPSQKVPRARR